MYLYFVLSVVVGYLIGLCWTTKQAIAWYSSTYGTGIILLSVSVVQPNLKDSFEDSIQDALVRHSFGLFRTTMMRTVSSKNRLIGSKRSQGSANSSHLWEESPGRSREY